MEIFAFATKTMVLKPDIFEGKQIETFVGTEEDSTIWNVFL